MKVTSVEIWDVTLDSLPWHHPVFVRVNTDEGISGLGEAGMAYGTGHSGAAAYVKNLSEGFLIGADPRNVEQLWETMFRGTFWAQGGGPVVFAAMSALDIACWDIRGKAMGQPVWQLLGGKTNDDLRCYASQIQFGWGEGPQTRLRQPEEYAEAARQAVADGYDAVKVDPATFDEHGGRVTGLTKIIPRRTLDLITSRVAAIRDAVGENVDILIELHASPGANAAVQIGQALEPYDCMIFEEGVHYLNSALQERLAHSVNIPMAAGERLYTRWGYRPYFEDQSLAMIQPDLCLVGGITEGKKVCDYAHTYDITVQAHVCGGPVTTAASLQLEAVIPNFQIHEQHVIALKPANRELCTPDYQPVNGKFKIPDAPGLGIELNEKALEKSARVTVTGTAQSLP